MPYHYVRHPIYTANIGLLAALSLATGSAWLVLNTLVLWAYYQASAKAKESEVSQCHQDYRDYMARKGRFLLPLRSGTTNAAASLEP